MSCAHTLLVRSHPGAVMGLRRTGYLATHDCSSAFRNKTKLCYAPGGDIVFCKVGHGVDLGHHRLRAEVHAKHARHVVCAHAAQAVAAAPPLTHSGARMPCTCWA